MSTDPTHDRTPERDYPTTANGESMLVNAEWHSERCAATRTRRYADCDCALVRVIVATEREAARAALARPPAAEHEHEWSYYDGNEHEGMESICRCGALLDDESGQVTPTPPAASEAERLRDEMTEEGESLPAMVTVAVVNALMAEEIGAGHYRWQVMNVVRPAIFATFAAARKEGPRER